MSIAKIWGTTEEERSRPFECDKHLAAPQSHYHRGISIRAPASDVYRWLCQLRFAPYSYDWIDFMGRKSPRRLIEGADALEVGQKILIGFDIVDFEPGRQITFVGDRRHQMVFGEMAATYEALPDDQGCRLLVKMAMKYPRGIHGFLVKTILPWGDLFMMRKQLLTFKALAESMTAERDS